MSGFTRDAIERTVRTAIQAAAAAVLALWIQAGSFGGIDWNALWQVALFAAGFTVLTAVAAKGSGSPNDASFTSDGP